MNDTVSLRWHFRRWLMAVDDFGRVIALGGVRYLNPADQVLEEMLTGWLPGLHQRDAVALDARARR